MSFIQHDVVKTAVSRSIAATMSEIFTEIDQDLAQTQLYKMLTLPPNPKLGHTCVGLFPWAKSLKKSPVEIGKMVSDALKTDDLITSTNLAGPYLNITFNKSKLAELVLIPINNESFFQTKLTENAPKTMIEFSQPNTHKELHVGHMRNLCLGDAVVKLHRYCDFPIVAATFPGDVGTHVAKCLWYLKKYNKEETPKARKGAWLGQMYTKAHNLLEDEKGSAKEEENRSELTEILSQLEAKSGEYYDLWVKTREWSIKLMQEIYNWADVTFDQWYWESEVDSRSVNLVKEYQEKGLFVEDQGAVGIDLSDDKLGFCLLLKSDGNGLYATKDIELAKTKFEEHQIEKNIYVVDDRQSHHFKQVFKVLEKMGFENAKNCFHLQYDMVELTDGAMSSRKGNIFPMQALIEEMVEMIKKNYLAKYQDTWENSEIDITANTIAAGAIKYGMTRIDNNKKIVFDLEDWLRLDGESGPYIQYAYARINSLLKKADFNGEYEGSFQHISHDLEVNLLLKLKDFNNVVEVACDQYKTSHLCGYLYELSKMFNSFYAECPVMKADSNELKIERLMICRAVALTLKQGLSLLGIKVPNRM